MPIYRVKLPGLKPLLVKADSQAKAVSQVVDVRTLSHSEMGDAIERGDRVYKAGDTLVPEEEAKPEPEPEEEEQPQENAQRRRRAAADE